MHATTLSLYMYVFAQYTHVIVTILLPKTNYAGIWLYATYIISYVGIIHQAYIPHNDTITRAHPKLDPAWDLLRV